MCRHDMIEIEKFSNLPIVMCANTISQILIRRKFSIRRGTITHNRTIDRVVCCGLSILSPQKCKRRKKRIIFSSRSFACIGSKSMFIWNGKYFVCSFHFAGFSSHRYADWKYTIQTWICRWISILSQSAFAFVYVNCLFAIVWRDEINQWKCAKNGGLFMVLVGNFN